MNLLQKPTIIRCAVFLLAACMIAGLVPVGVGQAEESGVRQAKYDGVTYSYKELKDYPDSVEVTGVVVPEHRTVLEIPETLEGKNVISLDLDSDVLPDQDKAEVGINKLVLSKNIRPLKAATKDGKVKYLPLWGLFKLESIEVEKGNKYLKAKDGILYNADMSAMLEYPVCKSKYKSGNNNATIRWFHERVETEDRYSYLYFFKCESGEGHIQREDQRGEKG